MASRRARFIAMAKEREARERTELKDQYEPPRSEPHVRRLVRRWRECPELRVAVHSLGCAVGLLVIMWMRGVQQAEAVRAARYAEMHAWKAPEVPKSVGEMGILQPDDWVDEPS